MNNHWGPQDDEVDFPDWMLPDNHPNKVRGNIKRKPAMSLEEAAKQAMEKPAVDVSNLSWDNWKPNKDF